MSGFWSTETMRERLPEYIKPFDERRIMSGAYELSMGTEARVTDERNRRRRIRLRLRKDDHIVIPPGQLAQLLVHERIEMPQDSLGFISMKSTLKMRGLINVSGFHVDPGYKGNLVFAVFNAGSTDILIKQFEPTFLLWIAPLDRYTNDAYGGSRQNRDEITSDQYMNLKGPTYNPTALADRVSALERRNKQWRAIIVSVLAVILAGSFSDIAESLQDVLSGILDWLE